MTGEPTVPDAYTIGLMRPGECGLPSDAARAAARRTSDYWLRAWWLGCARGLRGAERGKTC